eukprot:3488324-Rhodomonas_salina.1
MENGAGGHQPKGRVSHPRVVVRHQPSRDYAKVMIFLPGSLHETGVFAVEHASWAFTDLGDDHVKHHHDIQTVKNKFNNLSASTLSLNKAVTGNTEGEGGGSAKKSRKL